MAEQKIQTTGGVSLRVCVVLAFGLAIAPSSARADTVTLICETTEDYGTFARCNANGSNLPCVRALNTAVLKVNYDVGSVELVDAVGPVRWIAKAPSVTEDSVTWDDRSAWRSDAASPGQFKGSLSRLTGAVDLKLIKDDVWYFTGKCRVATQKF